ncbi:MAG: glycogen synthase GlgA [Acidimicrobiia bacterium]|nr:glycogen synthase GlgA [Acidimicrobiia bacterium]
MRVLMVGSEVEPFEKTGGLADVLGALPRALGRLGLEVDVVTPRYRGVDAGGQVTYVDVTMGPATHATKVTAVDVAPGVRVLLVDHPEYYDRAFLYGPPGGDYDDNAVRFGFLAHAALSAAAAQPVSYDVAHGHDWQAGLVPVLLANEPRYAGVARGAVLTIHNMAFQGIVDRAWLDALGLGQALFTPDALEYWGRVSFLKGGIRFSRLITTVSPTYAREIQTPEYGFGLEGFLAPRAADLVGILNGIDYDRWNPARDPHIPAPYSVGSVAGKRASKAALLESFGLEPPAGDERGRPVVGIVSRLTDQKGFDLVAALADRLPGFGCLFTVLGAGESRYETLWRGLAERYPDRVGVHIGFSEPLAHLVEAGADLFLMPSRFEPCGLNQMYSLCYGTVPVVRATGGLADTVRDYDPASGAGTGFTFRDYDAAALEGALVRALAVYGDEAAWARMQAAGMREDHSWDRSAREYVKVYRRATGQTDV